jgi:hypothetical protein
MVESYAHDMTTSRIPRIVALLSYIFMIVMNTVSTTLPLNGVTPDEVSDKYDTLFAPIGFTFSIWGVIFLLLGVYSVYQLFRDNEWIRDITPWFIASNLLNASWIFTWHYEVIWASLIVISTLLVVLIRITATTTSARTHWEHGFSASLPFNIYFGWITVATVANASALLVQQGFQGGVLFDGQGWAIAILIVAAIIGITTSYVRRALSYGLVLVWAYWGILSRHLSPEEWNGEYPGVILTVQILLPILAIAAVVAFVRYLRQPKAEIATTWLWSKKADAR